MHKENEMIFVGFWNKNIKMGAFLCFSLDTGKALEVLFEGGEIKKANLLNPKMKQRRSSRRQRIEMEGVSGRSRSASRKRNKKKIDDLKKNLIKGLGEIKNMIKSSNFNIMKNSTEQLRNEKIVRRARPKRNDSIYFLLYCFFCLINLHVFYSVLQYLTS